LSYRIEGNRTHLIDGFTFGAGLPQLWIEDFSLNLIIDGLRAAGGPGWLPTDVHLTADAPSSYVEELAGQGIVIRLRQPALKVTFPTSLLAAQMRSDWSEPESAEAMPRLPDSVSARVESIFDNTNPFHSAAISDFAFELDLTPRTLQRLLAKEGETFSGLTEKWRLKSALQLLACERTPISEISERLHYGHTSNFIRAFKRWTSTTPQGYRDQLVGHHRRES
jgi:AraC-like DNA-binding protein